MLMVAPTETACGSTASNSMSVIPTSRNTPVETFGSGDAIADCCCGASSRTPVEMEKGMPASSASEAGAGLTQAPVKMLGDTGASCTFATGRAFSYSGTWADTDVSEADTAIETPDTITGAIADVAISARGEEMASPMEMIGSAVEIAVSVDPTDTDAPPEMIGIAPTVLTLAAG